MGKARQLSSETIAQIIALKEAGKQTKEIADQLKVSDRGVRRYVARWREGGCNAIPTQKARSGRPRKTSRRADNVVKRDLEKCPRISARKIKENNCGLFSEVSVRTVSRRVHELGYTSHRPVKKPILTCKQKARRVAYARKYLQWDNADWLDVLWSDEATFTVTEGRGGHVYRKRGSDPLDPRYLCGTVKHPSSLMVWGCFSGRGLGKLIVLPANIKVNQDIYYELLNEHLEECFELTGASVFQQDGAPCHTAKSVITWLKDCEIKFIEDWPGNSPDLNPIENLWQVVKHGLQGKDVSTLPKLEKEIRACWDAIPTKKLHDLAMSMPRRLKDVKKRSGHPTKY